MRIASIYLSLPLLLLMGAPSKARAEPVVAQARDGAARQGKLHIGLHSGALLSSISSELGSTWQAKLGFGARLTDRLGLFASVGYAQPTVSSDLASSQLTAMGYQTSTTQQELQLTLGARWWFMAPGSSFNVYAGAGARAYLLKTRTEGESGGQLFLQNEETSTQYGYAVSSGGELRAGPGTVVLELELGGSGLPHLVTGDVSTTALGATLGYRLWF